MASASFLKGPSFSTPSGGDNAGVESLRSVPAQGDTGPFPVGEACILNFNGTEGPVGTMTGAVTVSSLVLRGTATMTAGIASVDVSSIITAAGGTTGLPSVGLKPCVCWGAGGTQLGDLYVSAIGPLTFSIASSNPLGVGAVNWMAVYDPTDT
jgi:hypothetical protein